MEIFWRLATVFYTAFEAMFIGSSKLVVIQWFLFRCESVVKFDVNHWNHEVCVVAEM
jgi:hypothetical protein